MNLTLSILIPVYNEIRFIERCLSSILESGIPLDSEILVIDGGSTDGSLDVVLRMKECFPSIKILHNERRKQVYGLNLGLSAAGGKYIVRCDAHSIYPQGYFTNFIEFFESNDEVYGNIGVAYITENESTGVRAGIAEAMQSPFGVGGSHRTSREVLAPRIVDTVLFGAWPAAIFKKVGPFNESFIRGQDYEHNLRIRRAGHLVAQIPGPKFTYFTRNTFGKLARMLSQYAYVKGQLLARDGKMSNVRSGMPAVCLLMAISLLVVSPLSLSVVGLIYISAGTGVSFRRFIALRDPKTFIGMVMAFPVMHGAHAVGFIDGFIRTFFLGQVSNSMESTR